MSVLFMLNILIKVDSGMVVLEVWLLSDFLLAHNGKSLTQAVDLRYNFNLKYAGLRLS